MKDYGDAPRLEMLSLVYHARKQSSRGNATSLTPNWGKGQGDRGPAMAVRVVFFDVGETLVDETRLWRAWADWLDVPHFAFFAMMGAVI